MTPNVWDNLSWKYEAAQVRSDSLDSLVEWPAQLRAVGEVQGKSILDVGCGSGRKAHYFALAGAKTVLGMDISESFIVPWQTRDKPANLEFCVGDSAKLLDIPAVNRRKYDLILCFQALALSADRQHLFSSMRRLQPKGGRLVFSTAHPFRYVTLRMERDRLPPAVAYRDDKPFSYPSMWDPSVITSDATPMISVVVNLLISSGYRLDRLSEPGLSEEQRIQFPQKSEWMDKYFGILLYEATAI